MRPATRTRLKSSEAIVAGLLALITLLSGGTQVAASVCVDCHTDEKTLKQNLTGFVRPRSALTSGAG